MNLEKEKNFYTVMLIGGITLLIGGTVILKITGFDGLKDFTNGLAGAWIGISSIKLYQIKNKPKKVEEQLILKHDERNTSIRGYAGYATFRITSSAIAIMLFIFLTLDYTRPLIVGFFLILIHYASFFFATKYYEKIL